MMNVFKSVDGAVLTVIHGTKGGRIRSVAIEHEWQVDLLKDVKGMADQKTGKLVERGDTVERSIRRVRWQMEKRGLVLADAGVTPHGLRHQYMQERFKEQFGVEAPVKGCDISGLDKREFKYKTLMLMERAGHSRGSIGASYYGSRRIIRRKSKGAASIHDDKQSAPGSEGLKETLNDNQGKESSNGND